MTRKPRARAQRAEEEKHRDSQQTDEPEIEVEVIKDLSPINGQHLIRGGGSDPYEDASNYWGR